MVKLYRKSYEAKVLVMPLGAHAAGTLAEIAASGVDGIMTLVPEPDAMGFFHHLAPLAISGWGEPAAGVTVETAVERADMVVLLATDIAEVSAQTCELAAAAAAKHGTLIAALAIGTDNWDTPEGPEAMVAMREAVDMVVLVRGLTLAAPFLDVLRGGARTEALHA
ncbi:hypothetical protein [Georgenia sp. AZ-5]|uniref:hypothetical protein n=1 Tax=Georgenia sp. AZ-5 TaxID=3367526 RepID=UPI003753F70F